MPAFLKNLNPVYVYTSIVNLIAILVGFGLVVWSEAQTDLVLTFIGGLIVMVTGVSIPIARNVAHVAQDSYDLGVRDGERVAGERSNGV